MQKSKLDLLKFKFGYISRIEAQIALSQTFIISSTTYNLLKNVDLVEEHALLIFVHVALSEYFDCSLSI